MRISNKKIIVWKQLEYDISFYKRTGFTIIQCEHCLKTHVCDGRFRHWKNLYCNGTLWGVPRKQLPEKEIHKPALMRYSYVRGDYERLHS